MFVRTENPYAEGLCDRWVVGSCRIHQRLPSFFMCQMTYSNDGTCQRTRQRIRRDGDVNHFKSVEAWVIRREDGQGAAQPGTWFGQGGPCRGPCGSARGRERRLEKTGPASRGKGCGAGSGRAYARRCFDVPSKRCIRSRSKTRGTVSPSVMEVVPLVRARKAMSSILTWR